MLFPLQSRALGFRYVSLGPCNLVCDTLPRVGLHSCVKGPIEVGAETQVSGLRKLASEVSFHLFGTVRARTFQAFPIDFHSKNMIELRIRPTNSFLLFN